MRRPLLHRTTAIGVCGILAVATAFAERKIIFEAPGEGGKPDVFAISADGSNLANLTDHPAVDGEPHWSPDGKQIAFSTNRDGNYEVYVMDPDGARVRRVTDTSATEADPDWSPDGRELVVLTLESGTRHLELIDVETLEV